MDENFSHEISKFFNHLGNARKMVLATAKDDRVTARTMSIVILNGLFYFQTDKAFLKYEQLCANPHVALCVDNVQVEGIAAFLGQPLADENSAFATIYSQKFRGSYDRYSRLNNEVLIAVRPTKISLWDYDENGQPFQAFFDMKQQVYTKKLYIRE